MELFIEINVLEKLNIDFQNENLSIGQSKLKEIIEEFNEIVVYIDKVFLNVGEYKQYSDSNQLFKKIYTKGSGLIKFYPNGIRDFIDLNSFKQSIVIVEKVNFKDKGDIEDKGGLYFSYDNYASKIEEIINNYHFKLDRSEPYKEWSNIFSKNILRLNEIILVDKYAYDKTTFNLHKSIYLLIKSVKKQCALNEIILISDCLNIPHFDKAEAKKEIQKELNINTEININYIHKPQDYKSNFLIHDRILYSNFIMLDCPVGFNVVKRTSNSIILCESIFDKFTYNRRRIHLKHLQALIDYNNN